jgi:SAM-dependent methyltransferase
MKKLLQFFNNKLHGYIRIAGLKKPYYRSDKILYSRFARFSVSAAHGATSLDVGSGPDPKNPFGARYIHGADLRENTEKNVVFADLAIGVLPFDGDSFDFVTAFDVLEHVQRVSMIDGETKFPFIGLMNEIFRVLKPGGVFFNIQPCFPGKEAFQDPTHVNIMTEDTLSLYFCEPAWARIYGYEGSFEMIEEGWVGGKYFSFMRKSAYQPIKDLNFIQQ